MQLIKAPDRVSARKAQTCGHISPPLLTRWRPKHAFGDGGPTPIFRSFSVYANCSNPTIVLIPLLSRKNLEACFLPRRRTSGRQGPQGWPRSWRTSLRVGNPRKSHVSDHGRYCAGIRLSCHPCSSVRDGERLSDHQGLFFRTSGKALALASHPRKRRRLCSCGPSVLGRSREITGRASVSPLSIRAIAAVSVQLEVSNHFVDMPIAGAMPNPVFRTDSSNRHAWLAPKPLD